MDSPFNQVMDKAEAGVQKNLRFLGPLLQLALR
ncbi:MAG: hypothetical protein ACI8UO_006736, partial [Verrucomicrobiales bacterium]